MKSLTDWSPGMRRLTLVAGWIGLLVLGTAGAASASFDPCPDPVFHLHRTDTGQLLLVTGAPTGTAPNFEDSPALSRAGGNPWQVIDTWETYVGGVTCLLTALSDLHVFLGLKSSDDQGTRFDLRAEVSVGGVPLTDGEVYCIDGVTRNPDKAKEAIVAFKPFTPTSRDGEVALTIKARIGTPSASCGGHSSAVGLRLYYDAANRDSRFDLVREAD